MSITLTQALRRATALRGAETGLIDGDRRFTWQQLAQRIDALTGALAARGVSAGDRVAFLALNSHLAFEVYFAVPALGGILTPLNPRCTDKELRHVIADAAPVALIIGAEFFDRLTAMQEAAPQLRLLIEASSSTTTSTGKLPSLEALLQENHRPPASQLTPDDVACLFYTGGTTGQPKGVMLTHGNISANSVNFICEVGVRSSSVHLHCGPLFHVAAAVRLYSVTLAAGTHVMLPRFAAEPVIETIARCGVTIATFVPTMLRALLDSPALAQCDLKRLDCITYGAAPMPEALLREAMTRLAPTRFVQSYGMTETSPIATMLSAQDHRLSGPLTRRLRSAGRPALLTQVRIADANGGVARPGVVGEIAVRGPNVMKGYWCNPEATAEALRDGWMHTGDVGYFDDDGYLYVVDRLKDMIITGGENVYSQEVENVIASLPGVHQCAVFGRPDARWGEAVHAVVVVVPGARLNEEDVRNHCRAVLADYKRPKSIELRSEPLPLSGANKVLKTRLRAELLERQAGEGGA